MGSRVRINLAIKVHLGVTLTLNRRYTRKLSHFERFTVASSFDLIFHRGHTEMYLLHKYTLQDIITQSSLGYATPDSLCSDVMNF